MSISKISRSIVVAIFAALILFLGITDFMYIGNDMSTMEGPSGIVKFGYFVLIYVYALYRRNRQINKMKIYVNYCTYLRGSVASPF